MIRKVFIFKLNIIILFICIKNLKLNKEQNKMGIHYCNCENYEEKEKKSEVHIEGQKINYNYRDLRQSPITSNTNNTSNSENSLGTNQDILIKRQEILNNIIQSEKQILKINAGIYAYTIGRNNENKIVLNSLSLIKERDQEDEVSEIENMKKTLIRYNNNNEYCRNKILINNNNSKINIYENNSYNIRYINQDESEQKLYDKLTKTASPKKTKNIIYRNDLKKHNKKQLIYEKKINLFNNNFNKNKFLNSKNDYYIKNEYKLPMMYKKANVIKPKILFKNQRKYKNNKIIYDLDN